MLPGNAGGDLNGLALCFSGRICTAQILRDWLYHHDRYVWDLEDVYFFCFSLILSHRGSGNKAKFCDNENLYIGQFGNLVGGGGEGEGNYKQGFKPHRIRLSNG